MAAQTSPLQERFRVRTVVQHRDLHGVTARRLLRRTNGLGKLSPGQLERWLLGAGFAEQNEVGQLVPTPLGRWVAGAINFLGD